MYEIIILIVIVLLIVCNKKTIENFTGEKCDINEQRFKLIEEKIALQKKLQPVVVNNNLCEERQDKKEVVQKVVQSTPPPQQPIIIKQDENSINMDEIENIILKERTENQKKLQEITDKIDKLSEIEEEENEENTEEEEDMKIYDLISEMKEGITMPSIPNDVINNIMIGMVVIIGLLFLYFGIVILMNMVRRKAKEIKLIDLSYEDAIKAVKEKALRKKYGLTDNIFK